METWSWQLKLKSPFSFVKKQYAQNGIISIINRKGSKMRLFFTCSCTKQTILVFYNHTAARYFPCHLWTFMRNSLIDFTVRQVYCRLVAESIQNKPVRSKLRFIQHDKLNNLTNFMRKGKIRGAIAANISIFDGNVYSFNFYSW